MFAYKTRLKLFNGFKVGIALEDRFEMVVVTENDKDWDEGYQPALFKGLYIYIACVEINFTKTFLMV